MLVLFDLKKRRDYGLTFSAELFGFAAGSAQFATHFDAKNSISAFLCGTLPVSSGTTITDCGPSAALNVHWNVCDCTPRCWQEFFSSAGSSISGFPCNWFATDDGTTATNMGTGALILMLITSPSRSGVYPPYTFKNEVSSYFSLAC